MVIALLSIGIGEVALRLGVAAVFGLIIGIDRERRERAAGVRTMALVGLGSALFTLAGAYGFSDIVAAQHLSVDPTRVMAQIVSGIGFLGAGVIFLRRDVVRGLTTAAALWVVAAIGMACGAGFWVAGIIGVVLALVVLTMVRPIERLVFPQHGPHKLLVRMDSLDAAGSAVPRVRAILDQHHVDVERYTLRQAKGGGELIVVRCRMKNPDDLPAAVHELRAVAGVNGVRVDVRVAEQP